LQADGTAVMSGRVVGHWYDFRVVLRCLNRGRGGWSAGYGRGTGMVAMCSAVDGWA
jgi:hypothetical protein